MKRLKCHAGFDPKRNQIKEIKEAGNIQPVMLKVRYSVKVNCLPKINRKAVMIKI
jgi:hypothetical protein